MSCERPTSKLPGESAAGKEFAQGGDHPSPPSLTPHFARLRRTVSDMTAPLQLSSPSQASETTTSATFFNMRLRWGSWAQSAAPKTVCTSRPSSPAFSVRAARASCRLTHLRCWVVPCRDSSSSAGSVRRVPSLHSSVSLRLGYTRPLLSPDGLFLLAARHSKQACSALARCVGCPRRRDSLPSCPQGSQEAKETLQGPRTPAPQALAQKIPARPAMASSGSCAASG